jgi:hypothetical protein
MQPILSIDQQHTLGKHQVSGIYFFYFLDCWVEFSAHLDSPATGNLSIGFLVFFLCLKENAKRVRKIASCYCLLLLQHTQFKFIKIIK